MSDDRRIRIFDTTLRDGEQSPGCSMNLSEKLTLARQLERLGVDVIEAGFPIASEGDFESVKAIAGELRDAVVAGLARTSPADIERAGRALERARRARIHTFIATSDIHLKHKLRMGREQVLEEVDRAVRQARACFVRWCRSSRSPGRVVLRWRACRRIGSAAPRRTVHWRDGGAVPPLRCLVTRGASPASPVEVDRPLLPADRAPPDDERSASREIGAPDLVTDRRRERVAIGPV